MYRIGGKKSFKLIDTAVPSIFVFTKITKGRPSSCERSKKRLKRDIIDEVCGSVHLCETSSVAEVISTESIDIEMGAKSEIINSKFVSTGTQTDDESTANESGSDYEYTSNDSKNNYQEFDNTNRKYILVEWENLKSLFKYCFICGADDIVTKVSTRGSFVKVHLDYSHKHMSEWTSQANKSGVCAGNMALVASILLSGLSFNVFQRAMQITDIQIIGERTFYNIQKKYLFPAINQVYEKRRDEIVEKLKGEKQLNVIGDGRFDSPGHSAKYRTYTFMDAHTNEIIDFFIAHKSNAGSSTQMEFYAFKKVLNYMLSSGLDISTIITDRHKSIRKYVCEKCPKLSHQFDVWHFVKKIKKKVNAKGKLKRNTNLLAWSKSITNHFW